MCQKVQNKHLFEHALGQNCLHLPFKPYIRKNEFIENVWPANSAMFIYLLPIALQQLNSLTPIDTFSRLSGPVVTHPTGLREVPGSIPGAVKDLYV